jgi:hypothetical protein
MAIRWYGLVAPEEASTGDRRMFARDTLTFRRFPLPAAWQRISSGGHQGAVTVASWDGEYAGQGGVWGAGTFLDPTIVPEVTEAIYLLEKRLAGPSVDLDPDLAYEVVEHPDRPDDYAIKVTRGNVHGLTFVSAPAFPQVHITVDTEEEMTILASAGITMATFAASGVNASSWQKFPLAPDRATSFDHDSAVDRIAAWSGGDAAKFGSAFLWKDPDGNALNRETYRLPVIDILDGKAYLIPRAVFSAGVIMSGGHGGLYDTLSEADRLKVQEVITDIYDYLRDQYADPRVVAPWQRGGRQGARNEADEPSRVASIEVEDMISEELDAYLTSRLAAAGITFAQPEGVTPVPGEVSSLTAAGVLKPAGNWFADPQLKGPTPLVVNEDGRVFGHLATWKQCHMGVGNKCTLAPRSRTNYGYFKTGSVLTAEGKTVRVGKITLGTGHADKSFGVVPAVEHYDHTGLGVAVVNAGEDSFGVWVAGALVDGITEAQAAELRRSPLSGDWRRVDGNLELVAALAVNSPGFTVLHEDVNGQYSLVAAGMLAEPDGSLGQPVPALEAGSDPSTFADVDAFLQGQLAADRAESIGRAFHDLLPPQEGCGCN